MYPARTIEDMEKSTNQQYNVTTQKQYFSKCNYFKYLQLFFSLEKYHSHYF